MIAVAIPVVDQWYMSEQLLSGPFEVIEIDQKNGLIALQFANGELDEFEAETWIKLQPKSVEAPQDWATTYELHNEDEYEGEYIEQEDDSIRIRSYGSFDELDD